MRNMLLTSALSGSLALYPLGIHAQDYDSWTLGREVLNSAANYTGVLTTAHTQVRKYITWDWNTALDVAVQLARTEALLREITESQQINTNPRELTVPTLKTDVLDSYAVHFRYCDNMLLSYFDGTGFKHGLSPQQIIDAPVLRARRAGRTFNRDQLGRVETVADPTVDDPTEGGVMMLQTNGDSTPIPACMGTEYDGALPEGTVAYMTSAVRKLGPRGSPSQESRPGDCPATHPDGSVSESREVKWRFPDSPYLQDFPALRDAVIKGTWETSEDGCYEFVTTPNPKIERGCPPGYSGDRLKESAMLEPGRDYRSATHLNTSPTYGEPYLVSGACRKVPPPPPPKTGYKSCSRGDCWWVDTSGGRNGGGGEGGGRDQSSSDVDGDGFGDYNDFDSRGFGGTSVSNGCGACNGPSSGPTGGGNNGGGDGGGKIVCTAMNARYGFGSYRQAIWLAHARRMSPYHQTGYHLIFLPLVRYGYRTEGKTHLAVRHALEHIARHRTADLRAEMQQRKRWILGRGYRAVLEPLCYAVGWLAGGRTVAGVEDVTQIATPRQSAKTTPKHFKNNRETVQ